MDFILNPGAYFSVLVPYKVTAVPLAPGEVIPPGMLVIPPVNPVATALAAAQQTSAEIGKIMDQAANPLPQKPPWEVIFTEKR